jgi:hypothetical protein
VRGAAGRTGQPRVAHQCSEDAEHDGQLLQRTEPAAHGGRRDLRDIGRRDHRGHAHADAAHQAPEHQQAHAIHQARTQRTQGQQYRGDLHRADAADAVGERTGVPRAGSGAEQRTRHGETDVGRIQPEVTAYGIDRAVDHGGIEAKQEAAECGGRSDQDDTCSCVLPEVTDGGRRRRCGIQIHCLSPIQSPAILRWQCRFIEVNTYA